MQHQQYWVYILYCANHSYYTGYTHDLSKRYQAHCAGTANCKYTRSFKPLKIAQAWAIVGEKSLAMRIERFIKTLSRAEKEVLIAQPTSLQQWLPETFPPQTCIKAMRE